MAEKSGLPRDYVITGVQVLEKKTLGEGSYGVVYLGKYCGIMCAVKKLKQSMFPAGRELDQLSELVLQSFYNESEKLCKVRHPNIVQLLGLYEDKDTRLPVIVMELMHESLSRLLYRTKSLPLYIEVNICHDVVQALAYLHMLRPPIVHRDLSSNNILLSMEYRAKITDLGVAKVDKGSFLNWDNTPAPGTLVYMPPEVRKVPAELSPAMDMFAVGVNLLQILTHKFPQPGPELASNVLGFSKMVPERERRREHLDMVGRSHSLRPILVDCLKDSARDRPSALKLCERLEKVKTGKSYLDSLQIAEVQLDQLEVAMQRVASLEHSVADLSQQLADKTSELERVANELKREREYTAQLLNQRARDQVAWEVQQQRNCTGQTATAQTPTEATESDSAVGGDGKGKNRRRLIFNFRRYRKKTEHTDSPTTEVTERVTPEHIPEVEPVISSSPTSDPGDEEEEDEIPYNLDEEEADSGMQSPLQSYKERRITWYSQVCLPQGLQGSTLRVHHCDGKLYLCGGANEDGTPNKSVFHCSVHNMTHWEKLTPEAPQYHCSSVVVHNELVLVGGHSSSSTGRCTGALSSYDSRAGLWVQRLPAMPTPRASTAAFVSGNYLVVVGGQKRDGEIVNTVEVLHIPSAKWETASGLPENYAGQSVALAADEVCLVGGSSEGGAGTSVFVASIPKILSSCRFFSLFANTDRSGKIWRQVANCPFTLMTALCIEDQYLTLGGQEVTNASEQPAGIIWMYGREENTWTPIQRLPSARQLCCAAILPDHRLVVLGGLPRFTTVDIAEMQ